MQLFPLSGAAGYKKENTHTVCRSRRTAGAAAADGIAYVFYVRNRKTITCIHRIKGCAKKKNDLRRPANDSNDLNTPFRMK